MSRIGVFAKTALSLPLGYGDLVTDILVARSYYQDGNGRIADATAFFATLALCTQALVTCFSTRTSRKGSGSLGPCLRC